MAIKKLLIRNYKSIEDTIIEMRPDVNIFVGENDSGKSTILEAISIVATGNLNGRSFEKQIKANLFNQNVREKYIASLKNIKSVMAPPTIIIEAYLDIEDQSFSGTNNELREDCAGIRMELAFNQTYAGIYKQMLKDGEIYDIPIEFYTVNYHYFKGTPVVYRFAPVKGVFIDTTRKDYSYVMDKFVTSNIATYLTAREQTDLSTAYRKSRHAFQENEVVKQLNHSISKNVKVNEKSVAIDLREDNVDEWKHQMSVIVESIPFENIGFGTQNSIKIELAIKNSKDQVNLIMMEEPENNLSYTNMTKLIDHVIESEGKQVFISTHSSYIANKLNLGNIFLLHNGKIESMSKLPDDTKRYFKKLPGYDTLRAVLAEKIILVEGPTDELIIQRAYLDEYGRLPMDDGIDVIVVDSLAFKRYCDIAVLLKKKMVIVTDNDGNIQKNINDKYSDYIGESNLIFVHEKNEDLNTIEPSVLEVNCENGKPTELFKEAVSKKNSMKNKSKQEVLDFMTNNKAEWALRVFDSENKINYPEYIKDAIKQYN
ncbi:ATP-dependent nuclease [Bariatricus sp. HCP28S3_A7]|uniref:ATP-dependent nuclease n=1 Tax=Bariatricus sp. HCP28S3_A7 TaxID=3438894 RepID=UPI003F8A7A08